MVIELGRPFNLPFTIKTARCLLANEFIKFTCNIDTYYLVL